MGQIHKTAYIAEGAIVLGNVTIEEEASVWFHTTIRGDRAAILIGKRSNIQDNCVIHVDSAHPVTIGENVTIGHSAVIHGCKIGDNSLIGMGAILLNGCVVGKNCIIGAGSLLPQNTIIPDNSLVLGSPARIKRTVTAQEITANKENALFYAKEAATYKENN